MTAEREGLHNCPDLLAKSSALGLQNETTMDTPKTEQVQREQDDEQKTEQDPERETANAGPKDTRSKTSSVKAKPRHSNNVRKLRMERMMSKAELARRAGLSTLTIDRVEKGMPCRMDTKRKILEALGLTPSDRVKVFGEDD